MIKQTIAELVDWLEADEAGSRERRARRLQHLLQAIPINEDGVFFHDGTLGVKLFDEVRLSYIHGLDLATVLLVLSYIERQIAAVLYATGWERAKKERFETLLQKAHEASLLSDTELTVFQHLRRVRNTYAHFQPPLDSESIDFRSVRMNELPDDVIGEDARQAIEALGSFFARQSSI